MSFLRELHFIVHDSGAIPLICCVHDWEAYIPRLEWSWNEATYSTRAEQYYILQSVLSLISKSISMCIEQKSLHTKGWNFRSFSLLYSRASDVTEKGQYLATGLPASKDSVSKIAKLSTGMRAWNVDECSGDGGLGKRHSSGTINRSMLVDGKPPDFYSQVHHIGKREERASDNQAWRRNWEKKTHQSNPHTSNRAGTWTLISCFDAMTYS